MSAHPWYSGDSWTTSCNARGYTESGLNVAENRKSGISDRLMKSKSRQPRMKDVSAMPAAEKAKPISTADGSARTASHESVKPSTVIATRNASAYDAQRKSDHSSS